MKTSLYWINRLGISSILGLAIIFSSCDTSSSSNDSETENTTEVVEETPESDSNNSPQDSMASRGLDMPTARVGYSFQTSFPKLFDLIKDDGFLLQDMEAYAKKIMVSGEVNTEKDFFDLLTMRDSTILPHLESPVVEYLDNVIYDDEAAFKTMMGELEKLGIGINTAEGMVTGLSSGPLLEDKVKEINSPTLTAFIDFENAYSNSMSSEYPFSDLSPYESMVLAGEVLMDNQPNPYFELIKDRFYYSLNNLTDIHLVYEPNARRDGNGMAITGGTSVDPYPYMTETETVKNFADKHSDSKYSQAIARISENMSEISSKPENIYIIVTEWIEELPEARMRVANHLANGEDIPHYLKIKRGDGNEYYAIAYRFYDDSEKAAAALEKVQPDFPDAKMIFVSVKGEELYQLGPSN